MALIDSVRAVCRRLVPHGWGELLAQHGLDIAADDLERELRTELPVIDRRIPGFEDFASEGRRGIEPGQPARSLLYHALASPNVLTGVRDEPLGAFPTLAEINAVENYVFGVEPPSLEELRFRFPGAPLTVAVFATEYRPAPETVHRKHADLCFSRTGVARVGTTESRYDAEARGFGPFVEGDDHAFRVLPARYAPYVAVQLTGREALFGPMNFNLLRKIPGELQRLFRGAGAPEPIDETRKFWVPLHKLFAGEECLRGFDLSVALEAHHVNEKIRRVHRRLRELGHDTGWQEPDLDEVPFCFTEGIAEFSRDPDSGEGLLTPVPHRRLVEPAEYRGEPLTFLVPPTRDHGLGPSLLIDSERGFRHAPEFVHVRHVVENGASRDLNDRPDVETRMRAGGYRARHYVDFTGDGYIEASCPELAGELPLNTPAYSLVTAPDFYPNCNQRELIEWWVRPEKVPEAFSEEIWHALPLTLSDERIAPNLQLEGANFQTDDNTVTTIVSIPAEGRTGQLGPEMSKTIRHRHLPDAAAGIFAPGWDTSRDNRGTVEHLASYGLGSPFPEDAKLCAAISAFWPAVAPDTGRSFSKVFRTVTPMTDEEIGIGNGLAWDGISGPRPVSQGGPLTVEYASFGHIDYVQQALDGRFSLTRTGRVDFAEYAARILAMARAYHALADRRTVESPRSPREEPRVLSFRPVAANSEELQAAETEVGVELRGVRRYQVVFGWDTFEMRHEDHRKVRVELRQTAMLFVGELPGVLFKRTGESWRAVPTP